VAAQVVRVHSLELAPELLHMRRSVSFLLLFGSILLTADVAHAQIYSWRDANGTLVLSDRPLSPTARAYAVANATEVRATRAVTRDKALRWEGLIQTHAALQRVRTSLVRAVMQVESGFDPWARSPKGAMGLMQIMPATAAEFGVRDPFNPYENVRAGVAYLRRLLDRFGENEELALAAYNAGPGAVERNGQRIPPYPETVDYVRKVRGATGSLAKTPSAPRVIYKTIDIVDGRAVARYSATRPATGFYEIVPSSR